MIECKARSRVGTEKGNIFRLRPQEFKESRRRRRSRQSGPHSSGNSYDDRKVGAAAAWVGVEFEMFFKLQNRRLG